MGIFISFFWTRIRTVLKITAECITLNGKEMMKRMIMLKNLMFATLLGLLIVSCEQPDGETEFINTNETEGFVSNTEKSDVFFEIETKTERPLLHMSFEGNISEADATAKFDEAIKVYLTKNKPENKGVSTEWYYRVATLTGTQSHNDTDGAVRVRIFFETNKGIKNELVWLNNPGHDRQKGQWDYYMFVTSLPGEAVSWVKLNTAHLQLRGTDGWFVKQFHTYMVASDQTVPATGATNIYTFPNVWLDNTCMRCWDTYKTGQGYGKLNF